MTKLKLELITHKIGTYNVENNATGDTCLPSEMQAFGICTILGFLSETNPISEQSYRSMLKDDSEQPSQIPSYLNWVRRRWHDREVY